MHAFSITLPEALRLMAVGAPIDQPDSSHGPGFRAVAGVMGRFEAYDPHESPSSRVDHATEFLSDPEFANTIRAAGHRAEIMHDTGYDYSNVVITSMPLR